MGKKKQKHNDKKKGRINPGLFPLKMSKDVLAYWGRIGYHPSDFGRLAMIWNHWKCPLEKKLEYLKEYADTHEGLHDVLADDVKKRIAFDESNIQSLKDNENGQYVFCVRYYDKLDNEYVDVCLTADFSMAYQATKLRKRKHSITKERLYRDACPGKNDYTEAGTLYYDKHGRLKDYYRVDAEDPETEGRDFTRSFIDIPYPFKPHDLVRMLDDPYDRHRVGIVRFVGTPGENVLFSKDPDKDYMDGSITLEWLEEDGNFSHDHIDPIRLEYCTLDDCGIRGGLMQSALSVLDGSDYLQTLQMDMELLQKGKGNSYRR